jgi:hypothetical protein
VELKQELATPVYWFDAQGRKVLEGKDEIKKRLLERGSPDIADALALTFAMPTGIRRGVEKLWHLFPSRKREWDPYAGI